MTGFVQMDGREVVLTGLGAAMFRNLPAGELGVVLDLAGRRHRPPSHGDHAGPPEAVETRYLLAFGQAAELVVEVIDAAVKANLGDELVSAMERLRAVRPEPPGPEAG